MIVDVKELYYLMSEKELNTFGRTKENKPKYKPFNFNGTYTSFRQCKDDWDAKIADPDNNVY